MKQLILSCLCAVALLSCSKGKDVPAPALLIDSYAAKYLVHQHTGAYFSFPEAYLMEYSGGKVVKRTGGMLCRLSNSCQDDYTLIQNVTSSGNTLHIDIKSGSSSFRALEQEWFFQMIGENKIAFQRYKNENSSSFDSLRYEYSGSGQLARITGFYVLKHAAGTFVGKRYEKDFFFNVAGNLEKVEKREFYDGESVSIMTTETFGNYDTSINPFQKLFMFDDTFYRSLSKNNFRSYRREVVALPGGNVIKSHSKEWALQYDGAAMPQFGL